LLSWAASGIATQVKRKVAVNSLDKHIYFVLKKIFW
jgi:hypothetical protein